MCVCVLFSRIAPNVLLYSAPTIKFQDTIRQVIMSLVSRNPAKRVAWALCRSPLRFGMADPKQKG